MITLETDWTDPDLGGEIDDAERIENGTASATTEWRVREKRHGREVFNWSVDCCDWNDDV